MTLDHRRQRRADYGASVHVGVIIETLYQHTLNGKIIDHF